MPVPHDEHTFQQIEAAIYRLAAEDPDPEHTPLQRFAGAAHAVASIAVQMLAEERGESVEAVLEPIVRAGRQLGPE